MPQVTLDEFISHPGKRGMIGLIHSTPWGGSLLVGAVHLSWVGKKGLDHFRPREDWWNVEVVSPPTPKKGRGAEAVPFSIRPPSGCSLRRGSPGEPRAPAAAERKLGVQKTFFPPQNLPSGFFLSPLVLSNRPYRPRNQKYLWLSQIK